MIREDSDGLWACIAEVPALGLEAQEDTRHQAADDKAPGALLSHLLSMRQKGTRFTDVSQGSWNLCTTCSAGWWCLSAELEVALLLLPAGMQGSLLRYLLLLQVRARTEKQLKKYKAFPQRKFAVKA